MNIPDEARTAATLAGSLTRYLRDFEKAVSIVQAAAAIENGHAERVEAASRVALAAASESAQRQAAGILSAAQAKVATMIQQAQATATAAAAETTRDAEAKLERLQQQNLEAERELESLRAEIEAATAQIRILDERAATARQSLRVA